MNDKDDKGGGVKVVMIGPELGPEGAGLSDAIHRILGGGPDPGREAYRERGRVTKAKFEEHKVPELDRQSYMCLFNGLRGDSFGDFFHSLVWLTEETDSLESARLAKALMEYFVGTVVTLQRCDSLYGTQFIAGSDEGALKQYSDVLKKATEALKRVEEKHALAATLREKH